MSISNRIEDARVLWQCNRKEGAFLNILIAAAATGRKRYPRPDYTDRESFIRFFQDSSKATLHVEFRKECLPIEEIFYKWIRCNLVHEAEIPCDIEFIEDEGNGRSIRAGGFPEYKLLVGENWIDFLIYAIVNAPENRGEFGQGQ